MWRIYYGDHQIYEGTVESAPTRNVQVIIQSDKSHNWQALSGHDFYIWREDGRWYGVDRFGLYDYLIDPGWKRVLFGRTLTAQEYNAVWHLAMSDPDMPPKTGFNKGERRPGQ